MSVIIPGHINPGQISTTQLDDLSVTDAKIASNAVTTTKILNDAVTNAKLENDSITLNSSTLALGGTLTLDTDDISEGGNLYYTQGRFDTAFTAKDTDDLSEGSTNLYHTDARAISAVESETALNLQEGVTIDADISIGDHNIRNNTALPATGIHIVSPEDKVAWAAVQLEEYGDDFADNDDKPFNISNPGIYGTVHGGTVASPTAVPDGKRVMNISGNARYGTGATETDTIAQMIFATNETQTATNRGGSVRWQIQPNGSTALSDALKLSGQGTTQLDLDYDPNGSFSKTVISSSSTNGIEVDSATTFTDLLTLDPVDYGDLPSSPVRGSIAYLVNDGANNYQNQPIYYEGSQWQYFNGTAVATS